VNRAQLRSRLLTAAFLVLLVAGWWYFAPTKIGGSTRYVITKGTSMEPLFHTGDLAIVRPAGQYKVGDVVAYWSTLLHTVALHRIVAIQGNSYTFKGDNNNFIDPTHPTRSELFGKLWIHVPHGGVWLSVLHGPATAAGICALLGLFIVFGFREQRHRRKRARKSIQGSLLQGTAIVNKSPDQGTGPRIDFGAFLTASATAAAVFVVLGAFAFARPATKPTEVTTAYKQQVSFGYSAHAPAGPVYPTGAIHTGDPIFLSLVNQVAVHIRYRFSSKGAHDIAGTERIVLQLTSQSGWTRTITLTPTTRFTGDHTSTTVKLDMRQLKALLAKVATLTGLPSAAYTVAVEPVVHIKGTDAGQPLNLSFSPSMSFQLGAQQLVPAGAQSTSIPTATSGNSAAPSGTGSTLAPSRGGTVGTPATAPATITVLGVSPEVSLLRWIGVVGLLLSLAATVYFYLRKRSEPFEESVRIQAQYGHMIVPIVGGEDLGWPPVDVPSIKSLVRLAEAGQRLILHNRKDNVDTYMVNEEGTVYRYQVKASNVVWGGWSEPGTPVKAAA
jgi:signal peptidase I